MRKTTDHISARNKYILTVISVAVVYLLIIFFITLFDKQSSETALIIIASIVLAMTLSYLVNLGFKTITDDAKRLNAKLLSSSNILKQDKSFIDSILANSSLTIIATDTDGIITLFNKRAEELLGYKEEELVGKHSPASFHKKSEIIERSKILSKELNKQIDPGFETFVAKTDAGVENADEWTYIAKDGTEYTMLLHITSIKDDKEQVIGYLGFAEDITQKKELSNALENQRMDLKTIFDTTNEGIAIIGPDTKFLLTNSALLRITGFSETELSKKKFSDLTGMDERADIITLLYKAKKTKLIESIKTTLIRKDQTSINANISTSIMPDKQRLLLSIRDIS